ncbi:hypothetical protein CLV59_103431 [Chitinophaga dinghuensis]|uniref:Uncharacterized protein n=1 Tax=Chitinophaga dinghuensis TaxID=1539050 RepID=A0A327W468_9BACT|nr:hypothetical protein [Chitinophaga dinghuensis]RAJ83463.1 hypothetical protein CLV59_103431 [Chitinophaga dinghuensis]
MNTNNNLYTNPLQQFFLEEFTGSEPYIPLCYFQLTPADAKSLPPSTEACDYYNEQNYYCVPLHKSISQFSSIV